jgi:hypothetical protein
MAKSKKKSGKEIEKKVEKDLTKIVKGKKLIWIIVGVLIIAVIVAGIFLLPNISLKTGELTNQQLKEALNNSLSGNTRIAIYPSTKLIQVTQDGNGWVGLGIKNVLTGTSANNAFSYSVSLSKVSGCSVGVSKAIAESWITTGINGTNINIPSGDFSVQKVLLTIPASAPLCTIRYGVYVKSAGSSYANTYFDVKINAKAK